MDQQKLYHQYHSLSVEVGANSGGIGCPSPAARAVYGLPGPSAAQIDQAFVAAMNREKEETSPPH